MRLRVGAFIYVWSLPNIPSDQALVFMAEYFPESYLQAYEQFTRGVENLNWDLEYSDPISTDGIPCTPELRVQVALSPRVSESRSALVVSTGLHGVEGFLGSAVLAKLIENWQRDSPKCRVILLHSLNPFGYHFMRRADQNNVDLNRNFLVDGKYQGTPELYGRLDSLLNPRKSPSSWDPGFELKAVANILCHGFSAVQEAVAGGQYDYPKGLFYGGSEISPLASWLQEKMPNWLRDIQNVVHLDVHSGLGKRANFQLITEMSIEPEFAQKLHTRFSPERCVNMSAASDDDRKIYRASGSFGSWVENQARKWNCGRYFFAVVEFGTYPPIQVLKALKRENQLFHWGAATDLQHPAKQRLREVFCPRSPDWRSRCLESAEDIAKWMCAQLMDFH